MKIQGKLEGMINESRIEGLAGIYGVAFYRIREMCFIYTRLTVCEKPREM